MSAWASRSTRFSICILGVICLLYSQSACDSRRQDETNEIVVASESRYRVVAEFSDAAQSGPSKPLLLRVEPLGDWHIAPDAPSSLELEAPPSVVFEQTRFDRDDALQCNDDLLEFGTRVHDESGEVPAAHGRLKFGICEGIGERCIIVRRDFDLPL